MQKISCDDYLKKRKELFDELKNLDRMYLQQFIGVSEEYNKRIQQFFTQCAKIE